MSSQLQSVLESRLVQLLSRYIGVFLIAKLGYDQTHADIATTQIAEFLIAGGLFVFDHISNYFQKKALVQKVIGDTKVIIAQSTPPISQVK